MADDATATPDPPDDDRRHLATIAAGDPNALEALASRHETAMLGLAGGLLNGRRDLAADVVQETWLRVLRHAGTFRGECAGQTWIYRILINQCHTARRRTERDATSEPLDERADVTPPESAYPASLLHRALEALEPAQRDAILLCYHAELTQARAAAILDLPEGTFKSRVRAGLHALRSRLAPEMTS